MIVPTNVTYRGSHTGGLSVPLKWDFIAVKVDIISIKCIAGVNVFSDVGACAKVQIYVWSYVFYEVIH